MLAKSEYSAFESTLNSSIVSYRTKTLLCISYDKLDHKVILVTLLQLTTLALALTLTLRLLTLLTSLETPSTPDFTDRQTYCPIWTNNMILLQQYCVEDNKL